MKIPKQQYSAEFKKLAVTRVTDGLTAGAAAKELELRAHTLQNGARRPRQARAPGREPRGSHQSRWNGHDCESSMCE